MKILFISELLDKSKETNDILKKYNFDIIHYRSPVKAIDNIEEIAPDIAVINTVDFPSHWKTISQFIRWNNSKYQTAIILLTTEEFKETGDADKAITIGIQGCIDLKNSFEQIFFEIHQIFNRYNYKTVSADEINTDVQLLFTNPVNGVIITGTVKAITDKKIIFLPDTYAHINGLNAGCIIDECSLKINKNLIVTSCRISSKNSFLELEFLKLSEHDKNIINGKESL